MDIKPIRNLFGIASRSDAISLILISNTFVWYLSVLNALQTVLGLNSTFLWAWIVHFSALIFAAFVGGTLARRVERTRFIILWMILGIVASLMLFSLEGLPDMLIGLISSFSGFALGLGMPVCMSYFADSGSVANRGRASGTTFLVSGVGIIAFGFLDSTNLLLMSLILGIWRLSGLLFFLWRKDHNLAVMNKKSISYKDIIKERSFILYFLPWIMFSCVNYLVAPMEPKFFADNDSLLVIQTAFMGIAAILGGVAIDSLGRKPVAIAGFSMLGLGTAVVGFFGTTEQVVLYFNAVIDGTAWGFLLVLFIMTLWGDLSHNYASEKYYALGVMPFFFSKLLEIIIDPYISPVSPNEIAPVLFSTTAFFLFLAVLPLFYAHETLPERIIKEKELKVYVEKAQEVAQKYY